MEKIVINNKEYQVKIAITDEDKETGFQNIKYLPENEGMLFIFNPPEDVSFWMKDTELELDIVFINEEFEVVKVVKGEPNSEEAHTAEDIAYVLEVNTGSGIKEGDELEFESDEDEDEKIKENMYVLNENGEVQMILEGGERIFSRDNTKKLIKFAKKAAKSNKDSDYRILGNRLFKFLSIQDNNEPEYVQGK